MGPSSKKYMTLTAHKLHADWLLPTFLALVKNCQDDSALRIDYESLDVTKEI